MAGFEAYPSGIELRARALSVRGLAAGYGDTNILENVDLDVYSGEIVGIVGASGAGKSVLLRAMLGLIPRRSGTVEMLGADYGNATDTERDGVNRRLGLMFQQGALFSSLTVLQNIEMPMREHLHLSPSLRSELARIKIELVGLPKDAAEKFPAELSGGMTKRAALARALALDPEIVFLDEPTSGLDPIGAAEFDRLILTLRDTLAFSVVMVTHDLDSLTAVCDRIAVLADRRVLVTGTLSEILAFDHPWVRAYFRGPRARHLEVAEPA